MITWVKVGAILGAIIGVFFFGYHLGGLHGLAALDALKAAQTSAALKMTQDALTAEHDQSVKQQKVIAQYDANNIDPVVPALATRLLNTPGYCPILSETAPHPAGAPTSPPKPSGDGSIERATQAVFDACAADAKQLKALIELSQ